MQGLVWWDIGLKYTANFSLPSGDKLKSTDITVWKEIYVVLIPFRPTMSDDLAR
jgi:hypothetical protein